MRERVPRGRLALKRLAAVEVRPTASHQHEFNAGALREELGFGDDRVSAPLTVLYYTGNGEPPVIEESSYTLYDAREQHPTRTEWRLYYTSDLLPRLAREGDLLVLFRAHEGPALRGVVARVGTEVERDLSRAITHGDQDILNRFLFITPSPPSQPASEEVVAALVAPPSAEAVGFVVAGHPLIARSIERDALPTTAEMAEAAQEIVRRDLGAGLDPDTLLDRALEAETALYYAVENEVGTRRLNELYAGGTPELARVLDFAMGIHQGRRSRRGHSLEGHFKVLLQREAIPFNEPGSSAKCITEGGERPDFIVPGCRQYRDPDYPVARLRMVACKSTERERWRQILREAQRIEEKFLLTVDEDLTDATIREMRAAHLRPFLPRPILDRIYATRQSRASLGDVGQLLDDLRAVV